MTIVKLKGRPNEKLQLSLGGNIKTETPIDVIYWLNRHLQVNFNISLEQLVERKNIDGINLDSLLWPYTTDSMTRYLKHRMELAGLRSDRFGFHSFRSGFLASCLIQGERRGEPISDVLVRCALITGWKALGTIEFGYIREAARRRILPTNMIGTTNFQPFTEKSILDQNEYEQFRHANSFEYHASEPQPIPTNKKSYLFTIKKYLLDLLRVENASQYANTYYVNQCYKWCLVRMGKQLYEMGEYRKDLNQRYKIKYQLYYHIGYEFLDASTLACPSAIPGVAKEMVKELRESGKIKAKLTEPTPMKDRSLTVSPREYVMRRSGRCRIRLDWTDEEDSRLIGGIERGEYVDVILKELPRRTDSDLYFHLRHLNKLREKEKLPALVLKRRPREAKQKRKSVRVAEREETSDEEEEVSKESESDDTDETENMKLDGWEEDSEDRYVVSESDSTPHRHPPPLPKRVSRVPSRNKGPGGKRRAE